MVVMMLKKDTLKTSVSIFLILFLLASLPMNSSFAKKKKIQPEATEATGVLSINKKFAITENDIKNPIKIKKIIDKKYKESLNNK
jgi:hypothetical protein